MFVLISAVACSISFLIFDGIYALIPPLAIPLFFVLQNPSVSFMLVGMLSCSSITCNLQILSNPVPVDVLDAVSRWARLNCQVRD